MPEFTDPRAVHFPAGDHGQMNDCWHVQAGDYADEPDVVIVVEHAVNRHGVDMREAVAGHVAWSLRAMYFADCGPGLCPGSANCQPCKDDAAIAEAGGAS